ncbi:HDOD domain-containing protein [Wenzhouxiangella sp. AB-CW3]|uniref:EAL and HDOD domain-containing protein n=1 Tax=Wenzhouxiangella sp. AB-CW3 TaxID=2771012 RepID=UPI00168A7159|nr:HDOD domain-containing protein [Wenzhouxiangella sp. AB-CW3]QOC21234.1 HDOD domain-containing protein [Wenzhouxiangella sp. AB-CW3]
MTESRDSLSVQELTEEEQDRHRVYMARQPIFDGDLEVYGYELLFRGSGQADQAEISGSAGAGEAATSTVMLNSIMEFDLENLVGDRIAFFNLTREFLLAGTDLPFSSTNVGIEVLENSKVDDDLLNALEHLALLGYEIALDDFTWGPGADRLLSVASMVKLDIQDLDREELPRIVAELQNKQVKLVAEKVETHEEMEMCRRLGFDYFQGFFLCKPTTLSARRLPESKLNTLRLIAKLQEPDVTPAQLEEIIQHDVTLNYRLLRTVNSAYYGLAVKIRSISHAVVYLGIPTIRSWARLLVLSGLEDRPSELVRLALTRARMCQLLTENLSDEASEAAFTVGLFSLLDAMLDIPMDRILPQLPLDEPLIEALETRDGPYGRLLTAVTRYEQGEWDEIDHDLYPVERLTSAYMEALAWAREQYRALMSG